MQCYPSSIETFVRLPLSNIDEVNEDTVSERLTLVSCGASASHRGG